MDNLTAEQRQRSMRRIKSTETRAEIRLRKKLWALGFRYRKNYKALPGTPDIVLTRPKIAIFVDGDFWHGRGHLENPGEQVGTNPAYWRKKLARNVERDKENNDALTRQGWLVLRFWESDIWRNLDCCVGVILSYL